MLGEPAARWDADGEFAATTAQGLGERVPGGQSAGTGGGLAPVPCQYSFIAADLPFSCSLGCSVVLADQVAENLPALDPGSSSASPRLRTILDEYAAHYNRQRIKRCPVLGGLINE